MKRSVSILLVVVMVLSTFALSAFADETDGARAIPGCQDGHTYMLGYKNGIYVDYGNAYNHRIDRRELYTCAVCGDSYLGNIVSSTFEKHDYIIDSSAPHLSHCDLCGRTQENDSVDHTTHTEDE